MRTGIFSAYISLYSVLTQQQCCWLHVHSNDDDDSKSQLRVHHSLKTKVEEHVHTLNQASKQEADSILEDIV